MFKKEPRNIFYLASISFHMILGLMFLFVKMSGESDSQEYLLVGFGNGFGSGSGSPGAQIENGTGAENKTPAEKSVEKKEELKKVELPKSKNTDEDKLITSDKKKEKDETTNSKIRPLIKGDGKKGRSGLGGNGEVEGGFGFELDFGGRGMRRIYSYNLPEYPEGVTKEIDLKLRFTILPDGTVSRILPLIKADARLEFTAINSLKNWRFEPLPKNAKQIDQTVVITFPYRLQ
jgi:protein TonB